jgi:hypothetical protein
MTTRKNKSDLISSSDAGKSSSDKHSDDRIDDVLQRIADITELLDHFDKRIKEIENRKPPTSPFDAFMKHPWLGTAILISFAIGVAIYIWYNKQDLIHYIDRSIDLLK